MISSKIERYMGLSIKAGSMIFGLDNIEKHRGRIFLAITEKDNTNRNAKLKELSLKLRIPLLISNVSLEDATGRKNCKAVAITEEHIAKAIINNTNENYQLFVEEDLIDQQQ